MAIAGKHALIKVMSDAAPTIFTNAAMSQVGGDNKVWQITNRAQRYWSRDFAVTVEVDDGVGGWIAPTGGFRIAHAGGKVVFNQSQTGVRATGRFVAVTAAAESNDYSLTINNELADSTVLDDAAVAFRLRQSTIIDASGTLAGFYNVDNLLQDRMLDGSPVVIEFDPDTENTATGDYLALYALLSTQEMGAAVDGLVTASVPFESDGEIFAEAK